MWARLARILNCGLARLAFCIASWSESLLRFRTKMVSKSSRATFVWLPSKRDASNTTSRRRACCNNWNSAFTKVEQNCPQVRAVVLLCRFRLCLRSTSAIWQVTKNAKKYNTLLQKAPHKATGERPKASMRRAMPARAQHLFVLTNSLATSSRSDIFNLVSASAANRNGNRINLL